MPPSTPGKSLRELQRSRLAMAAHVQDSRYSVQVKGQDEKENNTEEREPRGIEGRNISEYLGYSQSELVIAARGKPLA